MQHQKYTTQSLMFLLDLRFPLDIDELSWREVRGVEGRSRLYEGVGGDGEPGHQLFGHDARLGEEAAVVLGELGRIAAEGTHHQRRPRNALGRFGDLGPDPAGRNRCLGELFGRNVPYHVIVLNLRRKEEDVPSYYRSWFSFLIPPSQC